MKNLFAVMYLHGHLVTAMFLWPGAHVSDCQKINSQYSIFLDRRWKVAHLDQSPIMVDPYDKTYHYHRSDVKLTCEWHERNPVDNK